MSINFEKQIVLLLFLVYLLSVFTSLDETTETETSPAGPDLPLALAASTGLTSTPALAGLGL